MSVQSRATSRAAAPVAHFPSVTAFGVFRVNGGWAAFNNLGHLKTFRRRLTALSCAERQATRPLRTGVDIAFLVQDAGGAEVRAWQANSAIDHGEVANDRLSASPS